MARRNAFGVVFLCMAFSMWTPLIAGGTEPAAKPKVWIYTDMNDPTLPGPNKEGTLNDPDDVSAMAGYLLMANEFNTRGIVVASTHRIQHRNTPDQADWANRFFGEAYSADLPGLRTHLEGFPDLMQFIESSIKETAEKFGSSKRYRSLESYRTVALLLDEAKRLDPDQIINVLCWGSLTEPAILAAHCMATDQSDLLKRLRFIAHWTNSPLHQGSKLHPENVANCREDAAACAYLKQLAAAGTLSYHECGAIGQHGIVSGGPRGDVYFDQFRTSRLGTILVDGKYVHHRVDHSDSATYWVLLGKWGVSLDDIPPDGSNSEAQENRNEQAFRRTSLQIHDELLRRSRAAASLKP
ncbi:MAG: nucleoside hydrolase-like domain-containing protein [Planctomycetota bacterium]